jgi:endonuclease/exonuclease/phosphatase family metal-dependent hydrolase
MRLVTYNVRQWRGMDGRFSSDRITRILRELNADVVGLQEIFDPVRWENREKRPLREAAQALKSAYAFGKNQEVGTGFPTGDLGNAALVKGEIVSVRNYWLPKAVAPDGPEEQQRGLLEIGLVARQFPLTVFITHLDSSRGDHRLRVLQVRRVLEIVTACRDNHMLLGDLNANPGTDPVQHLRKAGYRDAFQEVGDGPAATIPLDDPFGRIDYFFVPEKMMGRLRKCWVRDDAAARAASDHLPVVLDMD